VIPTLEGCARLECDGGGGRATKKPAAVCLARAAWRSFAEYAFLEDSRYASERKMCDGELSAVGRNRRSRIKLEAFVENLPLMARAYENEEYVRDQIRTNAVEGY